MGKENIMPQEKIYQVRQHQVQGARGAPIPSGILKYTALYLQNTRKYAPRNL